MSRPVALALRALGLGDFLTGIPALKMLRRAVPEHELVLAAPAAFAPLVALVPEIDTLYPRDELQPLTGFGRAVDIGIDLHGKGPESRVLLSELEPSRVIGFADPVAGLEGPPWWPDEHEVTRWCRLVAQALGPSTEPWEGVPGSIAVPPAPSWLPAGATVVHPGAAAGSRRWPAERYGAVAAQLVASGHHVVVTAGPSETTLAREVSQAAPCETLNDLTLVELAALVASSRLVVCGDTGVAHLASAYSTPSVLLFGPVSPALWGPPNDSRHIVLWHGDGSGDPHGAEPDPALLKITVPEVLEAANLVDSMFAGTSTSV